VKIVYRTLETVAWLLPAHRLHSCVDLYQLVQGSHTCHCVLLRLHHISCWLPCSLQDSSYYVQFRMFSCEAYNILRKSADLILSLFHLMAGASIEAIRNNPENAMLKLQVRWSCWGQWCMVR
jgi:hypothetical protein